MNQDSEQNSSFHPALLHGENQNQGQKQKHKQEQKLKIKKMNNCMIYLLKFWLLLYDAFTKI